MYTFRIEGRNASPEVFIDREKQLIEISGISTLKNASWFYGNVLKWAVGFVLKGSELTVINIRLSRMNDSSSKWLFLIIKKLSEIMPPQSFRVNWYYQPANVKIQINGEILKLNSVIPVTLIAA